MIKCSICLKLFLTEEAFYSPLHLCRVKTPLTKNLTRKEEENLARINNKPLWYLEKRRNSGYLLLDGKHFSNGYSVLGPYHSRRAAQEAAEFLNWEPYE